MQQQAFTGEHRMLKGGLHCHTTRSDGKGTPEEVAKVKESYTGQYLAPILYRDAERTKRK